MPSQRFKWRTLGQACCIILIHSPQVNFQSFSLLSSPFSSILFVAIFWSTFEWILKQFYSVMARGVTARGALQMKMCSPDHTKRSWQAHEQTLPGILYPWHWCLVFLWFSSTGLLCPKHGGETASTQAKEGRTSVQSAFKPWLVRQPPKTVSPSLLLYCRNSLT